MKFVAEAPSNIALIKYWGKSSDREQWPANDSLSMTLTAARTITEARLFDGAEDEIVLGGKKAECSSHPKIFKHLEFLRNEVKHAPRLSIATHNTFPAACGIASSASGFAALTIAALGAWTETQSLAELHERGFDRERLSGLARMGSGSACRSLFGGMVLWQKAARPEQQTCKQLFTDQHWSLADLIIVLSDKQKDISSSDGHKAAWTSPLFNKRLERIEKRLPEMVRAIEKKDFSHVGRLIEEDACEMHAVSESAVPPVVYRSQATFRCMEWIQASRNKGEFEAYFTIDAGPNVHLICKQEDIAWISQKIAENFPDANIIRDQIGSGPNLKRSFV